MPRFFSHANRTVSNAPVTARQYFKFGWGQGGQDNGGCGRKLVLDYFRTAGGFASPFIERGCVQGYVKAIVYELRGYMDGFG